MPGALRSGVWRVRGAHWRRWPAAPGARAERIAVRPGAGSASFASFREPDAVGQLLAADVDFVCVATPDDRHFAAAKAALAAGKHVLIEKPSVLSLAELDELERLAREQGVLAKVVYHKLLDPDHKKLRTLVADGELQHVNNGYCTLLEPKSISAGQFAEWITGRNPGTYVAVHYIKLIDFTFGGRLASVACTGQRGLVGPADGPTWDSTQLRLIYEYDDGREAAFDIHTSWVTPDNFPGYVEQEVQFRFDNGVWNGHSRKRGVECTVEGTDAAGTQDHDEQPLQRHVPRTVGRAVAARLRHRGAGAVRPRSGDRRIRRAGIRAAGSGSSGPSAWLTTTWRPIGRPWPPCRRWKRFWPGMPPASRTASSKSIIRPAAWCCCGPDMQSVKFCTTDEWPVDDVRRRRGCWIRPAACSFDRK